MSDTVSEEEIFEAGIFGTTPSGWTLLHRRKFGDEQAAVRWMPKDQLPDLE